VAASHPSNPLRAQGVFKILNKAFSFFGFFCAWWQTCKRDGCLLAWWRQPRPGVFKILNKALKKLEKNFYHKVEKGEEVPVQSFVFFFLLLRPLVF
jgi:hypothetical protein